MLLILPKPAKILGYHSLAVNLESYDEIIVNKNNETNLFHLALMKQFDGYGSSHSSSFYILSISQQEEDCLELFQNIVNALNSNQKTFKLPASPLPAEPEPIGPKDRGAGFL